MFVKKKLLSFLMILILLIPQSSWSLNEGDETAFKKAVELTNAADYEGSRIIFENLTKAYPDKALYWFNLGNNYFLLKQYSLAMTAYQNVIKLNSPLANPARFYIAKSFRKLKDLKRAEKILLFLKKTNLPPHLMNEVLSELSSIEEETTPKSQQKDDYLRRGIKLYESKDYDSALAQFNKSLQANSNPKTLMMRGLTQLQRNHPEEAREDFARILEARDESLKEDAQFFLKKIQNQNWEKKYPYWLFLDLAGGFNSNIYENGKSESIKSGATVQFLSGMGYHFFKGQPVSFKLGYQFYQEEILGSPEAKFLSHSLQSFLNYDTHDWFVQGSAILQSQTLGSDPFLTKKSLSLKIQRSFGKHDLGAFYKYTENNSRSDIYSYLSGPTNNLKIYYNYNGTRYFVSLFASYTKNGIGDLTYTSGAVLPLASNSRTVGLTLDYYPNNIWELFNTLSYSDNTYENRALPSGGQRFDNRTDNSTKVSYKIAPATKVYLSEEVSFNNSTLSQGNVADKNFDKFVTLMGITWDALP